jgi:hypothetical protein
MIELDLDPDEKTLRQFGFIALGGLGTLAALAWFELAIFSGGWLGEARATVAYVLLALGAIGAILSLVHPRANKPLFIGLSIAAYPIGFVLSYVIMGTLFFLVITPIGLILRVLGRGPLARGPESGATTYWSECRPARPAESYFKQF